MDAQDADVDVNVSGDTDLPDKKKGLKKPKFGFGGKGIVIVYTVIG